MKIKELLEALQKLPDGWVVRRGFGNLHAYRGYTNFLALEVIDVPMSKQQLIRELLDYENRLFTGWKGGEFIYTEESPIVIAVEGYLSSNHVFDMQCHYVSRQEIESKETEIKIYKLLQDRQPTLIKISEKAYVAMLDRELLRQKEKFNSENRIFL